MMKSSRNAGYSSPSEAWIESSGDKTLRTPELSPAHLKKRLSDILPDAGRLEALRQTALMDTPSEEAFDRFTRLASQILNVPVALVSLIDDERHYFKSDVGLPEPHASSRERPMAKSFCHYTIALGHPLVIENAREHPLVCDNPATEEFDIGGYMGVPLLTSEGHGIGNFCAIDNESRQWTEEQLQGLEDLAALVVREIETRVLDRKLESAGEATERKAREAESEWERTAADEADEKTARREAQAAEHRLRKLLGDLNAIVWEADVSTFEFTYVSPQAEEILGYPPRQWIDELDFWSDIIHAKDGQEVVEYCKRHVQNGQSHTVEFRAHTADDEVIWIESITNVLTDETGRPENIRGVMVDITERKRAEQELRKSEQRFRRLLEQLPAAAYMCDREGLITYFNERAVEIWGREPNLHDPADRFCGSFKLYMPDGTPIDYSECWMALALKNNREYHEEILIERPDGSRVTGLAHTMPLHDASGRLIGGVNVLLDITERKKAERKLREAKERAEEMSRLKSNLLANMSHEIRTPITAILGLTASLEESVSGTPREEVRLIEQSSRQLMNTLDAVLVLAQLEGGEVDVDMELVDVTDKVNETVKPFQGQADEKNLSLDVTSSAPEAKARLDPTLLERILKNLVSNAIKFTADGGVTVTISATNNNVSITVSDTGVGISEEFHERLFDEFTQESTGFSRTHEGIGLGLPLTKKMTEQLEGTISVESEKGSGSTFTVTFPRASTESNPGEDRSKTDDSGTTADAGEMSAASVLLIEDNEIIRRVIVERLGKRHGYAVEAFEKAEPALDRAEEKAFDVVLVDISLPGIDGVEALQKLRSTETYKERPIIAVTGHALPGDRERFLEEGFSEHIGKPFSADDLGETIRMLET